MQPVDDLSTALRLAQLTQSAAEPVASMHSPTPPAGPASASSAHPTLDPGSTSGERRQQRQQQHDSVPAMIDPPPASRLQSSSANPPAAASTSAPTAPTASDNDNETDDLYGDLQSATAFFASPPTSAAAYSHALHAGLPALPALPPDLRSIVKSLQVISSELRLDKSLPALIAIITQQAGATRGIMLSKADEVNSTSGINGGWREGRTGSAAGVEGEEAEWVVEASANAEVRDSNGELLIVPPSPLNSVYHSAASASFQPAPAIASTSASAAPPSPTTLTFVSNPFTSLTTPAVSRSSSSSAATVPVPFSAASHAAASHTRHSSHNPSPTPSSYPYPASIVHYCIRSKKSVLLSDALSDPRFGRDPYVTGHSIRSILCTPLLHRDKLVSILYLENGASHAFTSDRLVVCRLLCQQAAISIDNARLYAQLARSNEQLELKVAQRTRELEEATRLANEANRMKSSFLANMSHEIRTPMNGVLGGASLLVETSTNLTAEQKEIVHIIRTSGEVMLTLINDILDLSKIEAGRVELDYTVFSLRGCIEGALDVLAEKASRKHVELLYSTGSGVADMVVGDALRLRQIVINLLSNAVKFTDRGEVLLYVETMEEDINNGGHDAHASSHPSDTIAAAFFPSFPHSTSAPITTAHMPTLQRTPSSRPHLPSERPYLYHIAVRDSGIGISHKALPNLFQSFSQVSSKEQQRQFGGTGLGLSISRQLCELMGGRMWVESQEGVGSVFHFTFRVWASSEGSPAYLQGVAHELAGKRVLLVKGSERPASMIAGMCEQWGMQVTLARSLSEVESMLKGAEHIDVVLVDYELDNSAAVDDSTQPPPPRRKASLSDSNEAEEQSATATDAQDSSSSSSPATAARVTGLDVAQLVRRSFPAGASPAVLMLCALSQRQRSMRTVVDAFLSKPVKPSKLFAALVAAQRPKLSHVIMGAATGASMSPVLHASNLVPLVPIVGWPSMDALSTLSKQSPGSSGASSDASFQTPEFPSRSLQTDTQQQPSNGKRKRDAAADSGSLSSVSPPAGFFTIASSSASASASPNSASPSPTSSSPTSAAHHTRQPAKPTRLSSTSSSAGLAPSSIWSPTPGSSSPILGNDSRHFFGKHPMRILAAEDNLINQKVLAKMLDRLGWPRELVTIVPNGRLAWDEVVAAVDDVRATGGALEAAPAGSDSDEEVAALGRRLQHEPFHLVFMDIFMPVMDGLEATTTIRTDSRIPASSQPYVVALTANAMTGDKQKCMEAGAEFFLSKPVTLGPLMQALRTGFAAMCKKRKQMLARQQREDGSRHARQEAGDGGGSDATASNSAGAAGSSVGSIIDSAEGRTAGAELRRRGVEQLIISPSLRPHKLSQLGSGGAAHVVGPPLHSSTTAFATPSSSSAGRLASAVSGTSPLSAPSHALLVGVQPQLISDMPALSFARFSSAPLSTLTGRMLATSQQLQLLATLGHVPSSPLRTMDGERTVTAGGLGQMESALVSSTSKAMQSTVPSG